MINQYIGLRDMREYFKVKNIFAADSFQERTKPICNLVQDSFIVVARYTVGRAGSFSESIYRAHALHANSLVTWCTMDFWSCSYNAIFENYDIRAVSLYDIISLVRICLTITRQDALA